MQKAGFVLWILVCAILVADIGDGFVRAQGSSGRIKTQEVDIVNANGEALLQIVDEPEGPEISLLDQNGRVRLGEGATNDGGEAVFFDAKNNNTVFLNGDNRENGLMDSLGITAPGLGRAGIIAQSAGAELAVGDDSGNDRASISCGSSKDISYFDVSRDKNAIFGVVNGKFAHVMFDDPQATPRADFGVETNNDAYFALADKTGGVPWQKAFKPDGSSTTVSGDASAAFGGAKSAIGSASSNNGRR